jgi:hypothetical protein
VHIARHSGTISRKHLETWLMTKGRKIATWSVLASALVLIAVAILLHRRRLQEPATITGAVTTQDADPRKQLPIADVEINATNGLADASIKSDDSGFFRLTLRKRPRKGQEVTLIFRHPKYQPLDMDQPFDGKLYLAHMVPISRNTAEIPSRPAIAVSNIRVRYSIKASRTMNVGSAVKTFQVENVGNVPCAGQSPCSPDSKWKAAIGSTALDAGMGNEFQNARVSCIAGPCPFTKIETEHFSKASQKITASALNWSNTATFLVEAEVIHIMQSQIDHQSYPVIFGLALNFTLPADAEGVSLEADLAGDTIIFPLGPDLFLSWANCNARVNRDHTKVYRCELKPGYRFPQ